MAQFDGSYIIATYKKQLSVLFVLRDEVDEFDNRHSGYWRSLVRWL